MGKKKVSQTWALLDLSSIYLNSSWKDCWQTSTILFSLKCHVGQVTHLDHNKYAEGV